MIEHRIEQVALLLLVAAVVAMLARKMRLPYTIGLVVTGVGLNFIHATPTLPLTKELIFSAFLPPLIFEAALFLPWKELKRDLPVILTLATVGVIVSAGVTFAGMHFLAHWEWKAALLFSVLIAATDPVSVIATFKEMRVEGRLKILVEAESLFNDGAAAVLFFIALAVVLGQAPSGMGIATGFLLTVFGGIGCGAVVAGALLLLTWRTDDHLVELTFSTVAAFGSFLLAEHFHMSGVLATLTAGLFFGNLGSMGVVSDQGREHGRNYWEYVAFLANSLIFLLIGLRLAEENFAGYALPIAVAIVSVLVGRAAAVYPLCLLFVRSSLRVSLPCQNILWWGGLRGALALALALGLPPDMPQRPAVTATAFAVVAFSVIVQGLTIKPLLRYADALPPDILPENAPSAGDVRSPDDAEAEPA